MNNDLILFQSSKANIREHIAHVFEAGELTRNATCKDFLQVQIEGIREGTRTRKFYNLDAIIDDKAQARSAKRK